MLLVVCVTRSSVVLIGNLCKESANADVFLIIVLIIVKSRHP